MGHHYLHINPDVKHHLAGILPAERWAELIVSDLTENGTQLAAVVLPPNEYGPQIALYGDRFFARASSDKYRSDTLWLYRVEPARNPTQVPQKIAGRFEVFEPGRHQPQRDAVAAIFGIDTEAIVDTTPVRVLRTKASPRVAKALAKVSAAIRASWRPLPAAPVPLPAREFLRLLRSLWGRYRLERFTSPTAREEWLLRGQLSTDSLSADERLSLSALVDVGTLNSLAADSDPTPSFFEELLRRIIELVPPNDVRAALWGAMLAGTSDVQLRDELRSAAPGLVAIVKTGDAERPWTKATLEGLSAAASRSADAAIVELLQKVEGDTHPLLGIAAWAERLESVEPQDLSSPKGEPEPLPLPVAHEPPLATVVAGIQRSSVDGVTERSESAVSQGAATAWALTRTIPNVDSFATSLQDLQAAAASLGQQPSTDSPEALLSAIAAVEALAERAQRCLEQIPPRAQLERELSEALRVHAAAHAMLGDDFDPTPPPFDSLSISELDDVVQLLREDRLLNTLPAWVWSAGGAGEPRPSDRATRSQRLCDPSVRRGVKQILPRVRDYPDIPEAAVSKISPPPAHIAADEHVRLELEQLRLAAQRLGRIPREHREWVQLALARGDDEEETLHTVDRFQALSARLPTHTVDALRYEVFCIDNPPTRERRLHQYEQAVRFFEQSLGTAVDVTAGQLKSRIERMHQPDASAADQPEHELAIDLNWVGTTKTRPPLVFVPHEDPNRPYGFVAVPTFVESHRRWEYHLRVDVRVRTKQRGQSWLQEWDRHTPERLDIGVQDWRRTPQGRFIYTFELRIPIRRPERSNEAFEFSTSLLDDVSGQALAPEKPLRWDSVELAFEPIAFDWPGGIRPDYVKAHPVGPQKRRARIEARLRGGNNFAVVAPRRFGKTTFVEYLRERAVDLRLLCPEPLYCTSFTDDRGAVDLKSIWRTVAEHLQAALECTVSADFPHDLPTPHGFDRARRAAAEAEYKGILLLFDESQLMFPATTGGRLGDRLKDLMERHWMSKSSSDTVPVLFGFVGLPSFATNIGVNFRNLLEPEEGLEMDEDDINRIILGVTKNKLHTTAESRQHLAQVAPNLYLARILVESLRERANKLQRLWVNYDDVAAVQAEIATQLELGRHGNIAALVRDSLNDSPDVNKWQPSPSYPVALALALSRHDGIRGAQPLAAHARQRLNAWCDDQQFGSGKPCYREEDVKRHIDKLGELGVFDRSDFRSRFVEAWLVGEAREGFPSSAINSLVKGASTIVSIPQLLDPVDRDGGQAKIFRFSRDGAQYALRLADLANESDRNRFLEAVATLKILTAGIPRAEPGIQYIFDLDAVGFSERDEMVGVHVYRWIDGQDLQTKVGQLPAGVASDIGMKLAIALQLLHRHRIIHRDIRPKNIVLSQTSKDPVLIDFGLAKFDGGRSHTRVSNEYTAPEVAQQPPKWTPAADVYALGATLRALLQPDATDQGAIRELLDRMTVESADARIEANELVTALDALRARYLVDGQLRSFLEQIDQAVEADRERKWYPPVVEKFKPTFRMLALGLHADMFDMCAELADFINQILEAYPVRRGGTQLKLGYIKNENDDTGDRFRLMSIEALHQLRLSLSHGDPTKSKASVRRKLGQPSDEQFRRWVLEAADAVGDYLGTNSLRSVVGHVLDQRTSAQTQVTR